jgi:hypothetical protein
MGSNRRSLHFATPDLLLNLMAPVNCMRLSLLKAAHLGAGESHEAGNPVRFDGMTRGGLESKTNFSASKKGGDGQHQASEDN